MKSIYMFTLFGTSVQVAFNLSGFGYTIPHAGGKGTLIYPLGSASPLQVAEPIEKVNQIVLDWSERSAVGLNNAR